MVASRLTLQRCSLLLLTLVFLGVSAISLIGREQPSQTPTPKLAVLLVFDQMRGDYLSRHRELFCEGGFKRLTSEGAWFVNCHYPYANTMTGPGHATLSTGCYSAIHGIITNEWYDVRAKKEAYCAGVDRYEQVPPLLVKPKTKPYGVSPERLLAPTIGDVFKEQFGSASRVVALSLKDRSSALPAGKHPDACYWADKDGRFVTSTYYRDRVHDWVDAFNKSGRADFWLNKKWERFRPDLDYVKYAGADDVPGEGKGSDQGRAFPHPIGLGPKKLKQHYYAALANSPFGNDLLLELAKKAVEAEKLGKHEKPDFLSVSFSSNDLIGHTWGPDSQEVMDVTLRSDAIVKDFLEFLDKKVGKGKYVVVLSADHGICPLPEVSRAKGEKARRIDPKRLFEKLEAHLNAVFPGETEKTLGKDSKSKSRWVEASGSNMIYLNATLIARRMTDRAKVAAEIAKWLPTQTGIKAAYTKAELNGPAEKLDAMGRKVKASFRADRSGDVCFVIAPYCLLTSNLTGTTHGTPHPYDTHVPLVAMGPGIKGGTRKDGVSPEHAAVILARSVKVSPPAKARVKVPEGLFGD